MTAATPSRVGEQRPGGRSARVRSDVLRAANELFVKVGFDAMTIDDVAARAGVHKTTVYRRWSTKSALVTDAALEHSAEAVPVPDTGSLRGDLRLLARSVVGNIGDDVGRRRASALIVAASGSDELAAGVHDFWRQRMDLTAVVVERAQQRGELPGDADAATIIETVIGPLWVRVLLTGEPISDEFADHVVDIIADGLGVA